MEKLKNLLSGHSDDKAEGASTSQPSGNLTGEATHLDRANMPGTWQDDSSPSYEATKGTGISTNPSAVPNTAGSSHLPSTEATRGTGISSSIGDQTYSSATGSRTTPQIGSNPDALAAASSALGTTSSTGTASGSHLTSSSHANPTSQISSTTRSTDAAPVTGTSSQYTSGVSRSTAETTGTPIADAFTGTQKSSNTEYVGGSAPGVAGQSVTREAPFSSSTATGSEDASAAAAGSGLTGQSLVDRSRKGDFTAAPGDGTPATITGFGGTSGVGNSSSSPSGGTKVSKPFASDPVSTEPLGASSSSALGAGGITSGNAASQSTSHYTGDSRDYTSVAGATAGTANPTGSGLDSATSGAYTGGSAPGVSGQSTTSAAPALGSSSDRGISGTGAATGAAAAGALGAGGLAAALSSSSSSNTNDPTLTSTGTSSRLGTSTSATGASATGTSGAGVEKSASGVGYGDQYNRLSDGTPSGIAISESSRGSTADRTAGTSSTTSHSTSAATKDSAHNYGRDVAAAAGVGAAGGLGAHELSKDRGATSATSAPSGQSYGGASTREYLGSGGPQIATTGSSRPVEVGGTTAAYTQQAPQYATPDPLPSTSQPTSGTGGSHFGRDAAIAGGTGAGAAGIYEATKQHSSSTTGPTGTSSIPSSTGLGSGSGTGTTGTSGTAGTGSGGYGDQYNHLADGTPSGIAIPDSVLPTSGGTGASSQRGTSGQHNYGRDAALGATAATAAAGTGAALSSTSADKPSPTSTGHGDQYNRLSDGTPSGVAATDSTLPTSRSVGGSSEPTTSGQHHLGRDAALGGAAAAGTGAALSGASADKPSTTSSSGYGDQYNRLSGGTPSGIATSDPAFPTSGLAGTSSQQNTSSQSHLGRDAALGGAAATGAASGAAATVAPGAAPSGTSAAKPSATSSSGYGDQYNRLSDGTPSGIATSDSAHQTIGSSGADSQRDVSGQHHYGRDAAIGGAAATAAASGAAATVAPGAASSGTSAAKPATTSSSGYGDQYNHLSDGTPSGIATSDPAHQAIGSATGTGSGVGSGITSESQRATSGHHLGRDAAVGGAGVAGAGAVAYGLSEREKDTANVPGSSNTAGNLGSSRATAGSHTHQGAGTTTTTTTTSTSTTKPSALATGTHDNIHHDDLDEPDSPTGTGETKKKRGFLSKILHRDDPNKLHKEPKDSRKSLEAEGADIPRTTHDAYGSASGVGGGKTAHIGTDGEIGQSGQTISGYGKQDPRHALPLAEAEKLEHQGVGQFGQQ